ncbi:hypothetical protein ACFOW4_06675 [Micromonospora sp. GCM10011542]|uniref:hypothetical protein n=1 Tax=Micromonospora sp. GCM10011542 TaxID=3317337 RepID=UPI003616F389
MDPCEETGRRDEAARVPPGGGRPSAAGDLPAWLAPHRPLQPLWVCAGCGDPWPCAVARLLLRARYEPDRVPLYILLAGVFAKAARDLYTLNPYDTPRPQALFTRFVDWADPRFR